MGAYRVLVVDDEVQYVDVMAFKFRNAGLEVLVARDGQEALEVALAESPSLIITDYQMPVLDGIALCRQLRANPVTSRIPVILLTAHGLDLGRDVVAEAGVTLLMSKPFSPRDLLARATELLTQQPNAVALTE